MHGAVAGGIANTNLTTYVSADSTRLVVGLSVAHYYHCSYDYN